MSKQVYRKSGFVSMSHLGEQVTFQMGYATLQRSSGEFFPDYGIQTLYAVGNHQANTLHPSVFEPVEDISPPGGTLLRHIEDTKDFACSFFRHCQSHIEGF